MSGTVVVNPDGGHAEFFKAQFDKLVLVFIVLVFACCMVFFLIKGMEEGVKWVERAIDTTLGALLTLLTGRVAMRAVDGVREAISGKSSDNGSEKPSTDQPSPLATASQPAPGSAVTEVVTS